MPEALSREAWYAALDKVTPELVLVSGIFGTPDQIEARLRELGEAGLRHIVIIPANVLVSRRSALFGFRTIWNLKRKLG